MTKATEGVVIPLKRADQFANLRCVFYTDFKLLI